MNKLIYLFLTLMVSFKISPLFAQEVYPESINALIVKSKENPLTEAFLPQKGGVGEFWLFPGRLERPADDRHQVPAGERVPICIRLYPINPLMEKLKTQMTAMQLILEDETEAPNLITVDIGTGARYLKEGPAECYLGMLRIPRQVKPGIYRLADLFMQDRDQNFISVREYLYEFSQADELEVLPPEKPIEEIKLLEIRGFGFDPRQQLEYANTVVVRTKQIFVFSGDKDELPKDGLRVFYQLKEDETLKGIYEAKCSPRLRTKNQFYCELRLTRPKSQWALRQIELELSQIYLKDSSGNLVLKIQDPALFKDKVKNTTTQFIYFGVDQNKEEGE